MLNHGHSYPYEIYSNNAKKRYEQLFQKEMMIEKCLALNENL